MTLAAASSLPAEAVSVPVVVAVLLTLTAVLAWLNAKVLKLPMVIGVMALSLGGSLLLVALNECGVSIDEPAKAVVEAIDFEAVVLEGMLAFLLFAGALHVNLNDLLRQKFVILTLATLGVVASTFVVGSLAFVLMPLLGFELTWLQALLFGAVVTPTDPIAVLGLMKSAGCPKELETKVVGESLFNDGVGVVVFLALLGVAFPAAGVTPEPLSAAGLAELFAVEVGGGIAVGLLCGFVAYQLIKRVDHASVEVMLTLALVVGGYVLCQETVIFGHHLSGPLAMVVAGLLIGNRGRVTGMSDHTREHLDTFWEVVDELLNAMLFALIGLEVLILALTRQALLAGLVMIPVVLLARAAAVGGGVGLLKATGLRSSFTPGARRVLVWAGLRGGISVALALAIPRDAGVTRDVVVTATYVVVAFSILVQGLTVPWVVRKAVRVGEASEGEGESRREGGESGRRSRL